MKRLLSLLACAAALLLGFPAVAADHLDGVVPLAKDDLTALAQVQAKPERHVMLYFGDHAN